MSRSPLPGNNSSLPNKRVSDVFNSEWLEPEDKDSTVIHFAGLSDPRAAFDSYVDLTIRDIVPHVEMIEDMLSRGWRGHLVFISSGGAVYGDIDNLPISEQQPPRPKGYYALQKLTVENALVFLASQFGFRLTILRVSNPYGSLVPKKGQGVIPILIDAALNGTTFTMFGSGQELRDYLHISDFVAALERVCSLDLPEPVNTINIGSGSGTPLIKLIELITALTGRELKVTRDPARFDVKSNVLDVSLAKQLLDWEPHVDIETGIGVMLDELMSASNYLPPYEKVVQQ